jgi:hypothetical protein
MFWWTTVAERQKARHRRHQHSDHDYEDALPATARSRASFFNEEFRRIRRLSHIRLAS